MLWHPDLSVSELASVAEPESAPAGVEAMERPVPLDGSRPGRHGSWWDLDVQLGYDWPMDTKGESVGSVGVRGGVTVIRGPWFLTGGAGFRYPVPGEPALAVQGELMHSGAGLWAQPGVEVDLSGRLNLQAAVGWSLLGVEVRHDALGSPAASTSLGLRLRIPIGLLVLGARERAVQAAEP